MFDVCSERGEKLDATHHQHARPAASVPEGFGRVKIPLRKEIKGFSRCNERSFVESGKWEFDKSFLPPLSIRNESVVNSFVCHGIAG